jgi:hypothetical protein
MIIICSFSAIETKPTIVLYPLQAMLYKIIPDAKHRKLRKVVKQLSIAS